MIQDLTISYVANGIETTLTIKDDHYDNLPYNLADIFEKVIRESDANPQTVIENLKKLNLLTEHHSGLRRNSYENDRRKSRCLCGSSL